MESQGQPQASACTSSCQELSSCANADLSVIDGCFLCTFKGFDVCLQKDWTEFPSIVSPQFQLGPFQWEVAVRPGSIHAAELGCQVAIFCMLANRREVYAKGLQTYPVRTQFTLTIVNRAQDEGRDAKGFQHDFTVGAIAHQCGSSNFMQFKKLKKMRAQYCPDGELHVRIELRLKMSPATRGAFRDWHWHVGSSIVKNGSSALQSLHNRSIENRCTGKDHKSTQCIEQEPRQLESQQTNHRFTQTSCHKKTQQSSQQSSQLNSSSEQSSPSRNSQATQEGLLACQSSRAALGHAAAALQDVNKRTAKLHVANSRLLGVMAALSAACATIERDVQHAETALERARLALAEAEPGFQASTTDTTSGAGQAMPVGGAGKAAFGRYSDASSDEGGPSSRVVA
eukprot:jgi/Ulvmu1/6920/UM031_0128.1